MSDTTNGQSPRNLTRRQILHTMGAALAVAPFAQILACSSEASSAAGGDGGGGASSSTSTSSSTGGTDGAWATGGTASMSGDYADPFTAGLGTTCALACASTLGPCYAETLERKDISEGQDGLPVRLAFLVVDDACKPVEGATVDIWHTSATGLYSGEDASDMCTFGDEAARAGRWFRGVQKTDAKGRADFDTCFPGWYSGRTIHIHFTVRIGDTEYVTSQLFFEDALTDEIIAKEPVYSDRGERSTNNTNDGVIAEGSVADYVFQTERMPDGAMLAWKTLVVRASTDTALCDIPGGTMGGGPGGPPPGGGG